MDADTSLVSERRCESRVTTSARNFLRSGFVGGVQNVSFIPNWICRAPVVGFTLRVDWPNVPGFEVPGLAERDAIEQVGGLQPKFQVCTFREAQRLLQNLLLATMGSVGGSVDIMRNAARERRDAGDFPSPRRSSPQNRRPGDRVLARGESPQE
jgi:hypothetical protein